MFIKGEFIFGYGPMTFLRDFRTLKASVRAHGPVLLRQFCSHSKSAFASHFHFDVSIGPLASTAHPLSCFARTLHCACSFAHSLIHSLLSLNNCIRFSVLWIIVKSFRNDTKKRIPTHEIEEANGSLFIVSLVRYICFSRWYRFNVSGYVYSTFREKWKSTKH